MQFGISEAAQHWATYRPHDIALLSDRRSLTYAVLNRRVERLARAIVGGIGPNQRIGVLVSDKIEFLTTVIAVLRTGGSVALLNQLLEPLALKECLQAARIRHLIIDAAFQDRDQTGHHLFTGVTLHKLAHLKRETQHESGGDFPVTGPRNEWGVFYSSGTTGTPKGIERDHYSVVTELLGWCFELNLTGQTHFYIGRPLFYTGGLLLALSNLLVGGTVAVNSTCDWADYSLHVTRHRIDLAFFVPDQLREFLRLAKAAPPRGNAARTILVMGGDIAAEEKQQASKILKSQIIESWGNTESLGTITAPADLKTRPRSIGRPFFTDRMYIVDRHGNKLPPGRIGRIAGGAEAGFLKYCAKPKATKDVKKGDLIISDDYGRVDSSGFFYIDGRAEDLVRVAGRMVFTNKAEAVLREHPRVRECAVVSAPKRGKGIRLIGVVVLEGAATRTTNILRETNKKLSAPPRIDSLIVVSTLPRNAAGKVDRMAVKNLAIQ